MRPHLVLQLAIAPLQVADVSDGELPQMLARSRRRHDCFHAEQLFRAGITTQHLSVTQTVAARH